MSHVLRDDLKVLLILLDGKEGCNRPDEVRRVRILLDGKEGSIVVQMVTIVTRVLQILLDG